MLDALILRYLTKRGVIAYFAGQIIFFGLLAFYVFGIEDNSMDQGETPFFIGMVVIALVWAGVCLLLWKKPKEIKDLNATETES